MATWPGTLPSKPLAAGFSQALPDNLVRTEMDAGAAKVRRRFTAGVQPVRAQLNLTDAQKDTLVTFYNTTLSHGADPFDWTDHLNSGTVSYRFVSPPRYDYDSPDNWLVSMELEIVP